MPLCAILPPSFDWLGWVVGCLCFSVCPAFACCFVVVVVGSSGGSEVIPTWECGGEGGFFTVVLPRLCLSVHGAVSTHLWRLGTVVGLMSLFVLAEVMLVVGTCDRFRFGQSLLLSGLPLSLHT